LVCFPVSKERLNGIILYPIITTAENKNGPDILVYQRNRKEPLTGDMMDDGD
jgi:hypothetical protein